MLELRLHQQCAGAGDWRGLDLPLEQLAESPDRALGRLEQDVAGEAVGGDDLEVTREHVLALDVTAEFHATFRLAQRGGGGAGQVRALAFLRAVRHHADPRMRDAQGGARVHLAHQRELDDLQRRAVDVGAHVDQHGPSCAAQCGERAADARAIDVIEPPQHEQPAGEDCAAVAGGDHAGALVLLHQVEADADRAVLLLAQRPPGVLVHLHDLGRVMDAQFLFASAVTLELLADAPLVADQHDFQPPLAMRAQRAFHRGRGSQVTAHRVERDQSSLPFITARPWYSPHFGHARCGRTGSPHFGHAPTFGAVAFQCARR